MVEQLGHSHGSNKHWMTCNKWVLQLWARSRDGGPVSYPVRGETERNPIKRPVAICDDVARACASTREVAELSNSSVHGPCVTPKASAAVNLDGMHVLTKEKGKTSVRLSLNEVFRLIGHKTPHISSAVCRVLKGTCIPN